jgi:predicted acyltransferase
MGGEVAGASSRLIELDVLRGVAVAGMILVVSPGDWAMTYPQLRHAEWNGWTLADMVFPTFLFSVGVSLGLSFPRHRLGQDDRRVFRRRVMRRAGLLIVIGLLLEYTFNLSIAAFGGTIGGPGLENLRIPGILQRIALCYLLATMVVVGTGKRDAEGWLSIRPRAGGGAIAVLLINYWCLLTFTPVPGYGTGRLDPEGNLGTYIYRLVFTPPHLWPLGWVEWGGPVVYDPEGLLATLPATAGTLFGVLAAWVWRREPERAGTIIGGAGLAILVAGLLLDPVFAINKRIWTSSFALLSSGFACLVLAALILLFRRGKAAGTLTPFQVLGGNAILAFIIATLMGRVYDMPIIMSGDGMVAPRPWLNDIALGVVGEPHLASTACAVSFVAAVTAILWSLHQRAVHFRL